MSRDHTHWWKVHFVTSTAEFLITDAKLRTTVPPLHCIIFHNVMFTLCLSICGFLILNTTPNPAGEQIYPPPPLNLAESSECSRDLQKSWFKNITKPTWNILFSSRWKTNSLGYLLQTAASRKHGTLRALLIDAPGKSSIRSRYFNGGEDGTSANILTNYLLGLSQ